MSPHAPIRVVIVSRERLWWKALSLVLAHDKRIEVIGEAVDELQAVETLAGFSPDVVLLALESPASGGLDLIHAIKHTKPRARPLVLVGDGDETVVVDAMKAGARGFVSKNASACDLRKAIHAIHTGELWATRTLMARFVSAKLGPDGDREPLTEAKETLTAREQEVLHLLYVASDPLNATDPTGNAALIGPGIGLVAGAIAGAAGAIAQNSSITDVAAATILGAVSGATIGASVTSRAMIAAAAGLTDLTTQLVQSIGCPGSIINVGSIVGSVAAATITAGLGSRVSVLKGFDPRFVQEVAKAAMGLPTAIIPMVGGQLDPVTNLQRR